MDSVRMCVDRLVAIMEENIWPLSTIRQPPRTKPNHGRVCVCMGFGVGQSWEFIKDDGLGHQNRNAESSTSLATQRLLIPPPLPITGLVSFVSIRHL